MASSKVMASTSNSRTSDHTSLSSHHHHHQRPHHQRHHHDHPPSSVPMISDFAPNSDPQRTTSDLDGILRNVYAENSAPVTEDGLLDNEITLIDAAGAISAIDGGAEPSIRRQNSSSIHGKTVDDVWREIVAGKTERGGECKPEAPDEMMTLEDFLAKAGVGSEDEVEDIKVTVSGPPMLAHQRLSSGGLFGFDPLVQGPYLGLQTAVGDGGLMGVGNGGGEVVVGRGKRRGGPIMEPLDKAAQQRQRRMIKNRESAARSRERKQAYQVELEALAVKLEEENEQLLREKVALSPKFLCRCWGLLV
ncbi:hypothetical protein Cgig2_006796 [Carnegiea gigantea]|uniref:BZIP domain-containing protein n=1 Tax=Carnegiea gigantea TaxID=171969 RepID=A0A9Q1JNY8_9CARY|nr:hypothetical protein Cgig2_006796 [Carnegiea gigantea]